MSTMAAPPLVPRRRLAFWSTPPGIALCVVAGVTVVVLGVMAVYHLGGKADSVRPAAQTVTVTAAPPQAIGGADAAFFAALAGYGISDNGTGYVRQRFMEFGHHSCFSLMPPKPQPFESVVNAIVATENQDVAVGNPWSPGFTRADAEHLAQAAITAYCPDVPR